ncbi:hypothetical protein GF371_01280 [Candidatus Woesearchaeota archaeon]|nr:hypothetical protein [Candidatus Woesearchaeota archaeon]
MAGNKTRDGIKLTKIVSAVSDIGGVIIRDGTNHQYVINYAGRRPCPLDTSTDAKRMIVPWLYAITGYDKNGIYQNLRKGRWKN